MSEPPTPTEDDGARRDRDDARLGLADLTRVAGVSVRTVRYYIAEGLLPPPAGGGPRSHYTAAHLDRLRLIARLKDDFLPLKEIRRRLAGLDDADVRRVLATDGPDPAAATPVDDAAAYLDRIQGPPSGRSSPARPPPTPPPARFAEASAPRFKIRGQLGGPESAAVDPATSRASFAAAEDDPPGPALGAPPSSPVLGRAEPTTFPFADAPTAGGPDPAPATWRRVPLGDDAELLIRESAYARRRDRVEWLIAWARKVFG